METNLLLGVALTLFVLRGICVCGITGGVIGALGSPTGIVVMILVALGIIGGALVIRLGKKQ